MEDQSTDSILQTMAATPEAAAPRETDGSTSALLSAMSGNERGANMLAQHRRLAEVRQQDQEQGDTYGERFAHQLAGRLPFVSTGYNAATQAQYQSAQRRFQAGSATDEDYSTIATHERRQGEAAERRSTNTGAFLEAAAQGAGMLPEMVGGGALAGAAVRGAGLLARGGRFAAQLAATPSMWQPVMQQNNQEHGREWYDPRGLPVGLAHGAMVQAIFGQLNPIAKGVAARAGGGILGRIAGAGAAGTTGLIEDEAMHAVQRYSGMDTGYGTIHHLLSGEPGALGEAIGSGLAFAAFSQMHGNDSPVMDRLRRYTSEMASRGTPRARAAANLQRALEPLEHPDMNRERAREIAGKLPEGKLRDFAMSIADAIPEQLAPHGPEPGIERSQEAPAAPERAPGEQQWHNTGTEFRDVPGKPIEYTARDGKTYSLEHQSHEPSESWGEHGGASVRVRNAEGDIVAYASFKRDPQGFLRGDVNVKRSDQASSESRLAPKGAGRAIYDYAHTVIGDIKPENKLAKSDAGKLMWRQNAEFAARGVENGRTESERGPTPVRQDASGAPAGGPSGATESIPGRGTEVRPGPAPVESPSRPSLEDLRNTAKFLGLNATGGEQVLLGRIRAHHAGGKMLESLTAPSAVHVERAVANPHTDNLIRAVESMSPESLDAQLQADLAEVRRLANAKEAQDEIARDARRAGVSETSLRRVQHAELQKVAQNAEVPPARPGGPARPEPSPTEGPAQAPGGREAVGPTDASAVAGSRAPGGYELTPVNELSRLAKRGDRAAAAELRRRVNEQAPPTPPPPEGAPQGWEHWDNFQRGNFLRAKSDWLKENVRLRNNGETTLADRIVKDGGIDKGSLVDSGRWQETFGDRIFKVKGKKAQAVDVLAEHLKSKFPAEFEGKHPEDAVFDMLTKHYLADAADQMAHLERGAGSEQIREARNDFGKEYLEGHPQAGEAEIEAEWQAGLRQAGEAQGRARSPVEIVREEARGDRPSDAGARSGDFNPAELERGNPRASPEPADRNAADTGGPQRPRGGIGEFLKSESGTAWVPSQEVLAEAIQKLKGKPAEPAKESVKELPGVIYRDRQGNVIPPTQADPPQVQARKIADKILDTRKLFVLSGIKVMGKISAASFERIAIAPIEQGAGSIIRNLPGLARISALAPREGRGFSSAVEKAALYDGLTKGMMDAWSHVRTGESALDVQYGGDKHKEDMAGRSSWLGGRFLAWVGSLHAAAKAPAVRAEFTRSWLNRIEEAARRGEDVTAPGIRERIGVEAYKDSQRAKFQNENWAVDKYKEFVKGLRDEKAPAGARALGFGLDLALPIVRIPSNIVAEAFNYTFGTFTGGARVAHAHWTGGIENMKPEQADLIMRSLKKGSLGLVALGVGFFNPQIFGGFYSGRRDESDVEAGGIRTGLGTIPSWLLHNPLLEVFQVGATTRRALTPSRRSAHPDAITAFGAGIMGLAEEVPFARTATQFAQMADSHTRGRALGEFTKGLAVPQLFQWLAGRTDTDTGNPITGTTIRRNPKGVLQYIETGIPGLRQTVPRGR